MKFIVIIINNKLYTYQTDSQDKVKNLSINDGQYFELNFNKLKKSLNNFKFSLVERTNLSNLKEVSFKLIYDRMKVDLLQLFSELFLPCKKWEVESLDTILPLLLNLEGEKIDLRKNKYEMVLSENRKLTLKEVNKEVEAGLKIDKIAKLNLFKHLSNEKKAELNLRKIKLRLEEVEVKMEELEWELEKEKEKNKRLKKKLLDKDEKIVQITDEFDKEIAKSGVAMKIEKEANEVIAELYGKIDISNLSKFTEDMEKIYNGGYKKIILDFSNVKRVDSSGLGKILLYHKKMNSREGKLKIINVNNASVKKMFKMVRLNKVIDIEGLK